MGEHKYLNFNSSGKYTKEIDIGILTIFGFIVLSLSLSIPFLNENISHIENSVKYLTDSEYYYWRPIWALTFIIDKYIWGMNPFGFHLTNIFLHLVNVALVYLLSLNLGINRLFGLMTALLFLSHPIHAQNLFWLSARTDSLCAVFMFSSIITFIFYEKSNRRWKYFVSIILFSLALFSKEMAMSLPFILIAYILILDKSHGIVIKLKKVLPFFLILFSFIIVKYWMNPEVFINDIHSNINPIHLLKNLASFIGLLIIPGGHIAIADFLRQNPLVFIVLSMGTIFIGVLGIWWIRKYPVALFLILFLLLSLMPVIRLLMRWYLYIPSAGFCILAGWAFMLWSKKKFGKTALPLLIIIITLYTYILVEEQFKWIEAGKIASKVSESIAHVIYENNLDSAVVLTHPAEINEVAIMNFGIHGNVNHYLKLIDKNSDSQVNVYALNYISLTDSSDFSNIEIIHTVDRTFLISLKHSEAYFTFPGHPKVVNGEVELKNGIHLKNKFGNLKIVKMMNNKVIEVEQYIPENIPIIIPCKKSGFSMMIFNKPHK